MLTRRMMMAAAAAAGGGSVSYYDAVLADNPIVYLRLGEESGTTAVDEIGDNDGTYESGSASYTLGVNGPPGTGGKAVSLGDDARVEIPDAALFRFQQGDPFSIEFWTSPISDYQVTGTGTGTSEFDLMGHDDGNSGWAFFRYNGDNGIRFATNNGNVQTGFPNTLVSGNWYHFVAAYDGNEVEWIVNGVSRAQGDPNYAGEPSAGNPIIIGKRGQHATQKRYAGAMAEFAVYDYTLSVQRAAEHYNIGSS